MNLSTKKKYLKIINTHNLIENSLGGNAPYISKGRIIELIGEFLFNTEGMILSRSVYYEAMKHEKILKEEKMYL